MNKEKVSLIIKNMESLIRLLKIEIGEETNILNLDELMTHVEKFDYQETDDYEPDYYEER